MDIFMRIFELIPHAKELFPLKTAVGEALVEHPYLKGHAMRFFNAIGMTVLHLDAWQVSGCNIKKLYFPSKLNLIKASTRRLLWLSVLVELLDLGYVLI